MRVAFVNRMVGFTRGGGEIWALRMAEHLRDHGVEVTFVIGAPLRGAVPDPVESFPSIEVPTPHLQERALAAPRGIGGVLADVDARLFVDRVAKHLRDHDEFDVVHVNGRPEFARHRDAFDQPVTVKMNGPPHSLWYDTLNPVRSSYDLLARFDAIVTTGVTTDVVRSNVDHDRIVPINPGVDTGHFTPADAVSERGSTADVTAKGEATADGIDRLLFVGRFVPAKNLHLLVDAVATLRTHRDVELVLVGDGPLRDALETYVERAGVADVVRFEGYVDNAELPTYYRAADAFVLSSRTDNCPITVLEAMSCGTPPVVPRLGWLPNLLDDGVDGVLYETGSADALVSTLETVLDDDAGRDAMGQRARETAVENFDWSQRARRLRDLYAELL